MKRVGILGISGSVGESTLRVLRQFKNEFHLTAFSVHNNWKKAEELIYEFSPETVCISNPTSQAKALGTKINKTKIIYGEQGLEEIASYPGVDILLIAIVGSVGVKPAVQAIRNGKDLAIANKETLVTFGPFIQKLLQVSKSKIIPVDSEHNALFQILEGRNTESIQSIILTASGGALREYPIEKLKFVTVQEALKHPTWSMGPKITIDSAGLVNKGLEVMEAHFLFGMDYNKIHVVIHPQSIIHGMVEMVDGAIFAYASHPDMAFPIAHSLFYPKSIPGLIKESKPTSWKKLEFYEPDSSRYPALKLAYEAGRKGGTATAIFNAANEEACGLFLQEKIQFLEIPELIQKSLESIPTEYPNELEGYLYADQVARDFVRTHYLKQNKPKEARLVKC